MIQDMSASACILSYGRNLPKKDHGLRTLHFTKLDKAHDRLADALWQSAMYVSPHPWQIPDKVCDLTIENIESIRNTVDFIFCMPPSESTLYLYPHFWNEVSGWLSSEGMIIAVAADVVVNSYLQRLNKYTTYYKLQQYDYSRLTPEQQSDVNQAFALLRVDIIAWSANTLSTVNSNVCAELLTDLADLHRCLIFKKNKEFTLLGMA